MKATRFVPALALSITLMLLLGCEGDIGGIIDDVVNGNMNGNGNANGNDGGAADLVSLDVFATNTSHASGLAIRPSDGALFLANSNGVFGPIEDGDDLSTMTPIGGTNLASADIFDLDADSLVLAITNSGEFWIGSQCCKTMAVVPAAGGDAEPYEELLFGVDAINISAETLVIVPSGFSGDQMKPGNLLVGQDTTFSRLAAIDVDGDRAVVRVDNPIEDTQNREAHHLAFGPDGTLYSSRAAASTSLAGIQSIATDGTPTPLANSEGIAAHSFVIRDSGQFVIRGAFTRGGSDTDNGILFWSSGDGDPTLALDIPALDRSEDDEMVIASDGTIYMALPNQSEIVRVVNAQ